MIINGINYEENIIFTSNPLQFVVGDNVELQANFKLRYQIAINYDSSLGSASYQWGQGNNVMLVANPNANAQFVGWYIGQTKISSDETFEYEVNEDTTFEARFERVWDITTNASGSGSIQYTRQDNDKNIVEFSVIPSANHHFVKYVVGDDEYTTTPLQLTLTSDISITAHFEEDDKFHITAKTDIPNNSVYISQNDVYSGTQITLYARPFPNYNFVKWSDGATENPRSLVVIENTTLIAEYSHEVETNGIYQYRCWVKDQMNMTLPPKAFMVVDTFTLKEDYLTNATSRISVLKIADNINNGDVIVVYNPKGEVIYNGVITSMSENTITTSQMQSFYKGLWIYNVSPKTTLEQELAYLLGQYAQGKIYKSTYTDGLVAQRLGGITIQSVNATQVHLPTDLDKDGNEQLTQYDMEKFIYKMYQDYGIVFEFEINFEGANYVNIKVPTYTSLKVGNNHYAIQNLSPITTIEETNRLIIYSKAKAYRTTYVATKQGIVEQPSTTANRFDITNTKVVFSDDDVSDLVASNLPNTMYNHKITFTLFIKNAIYQYKEFILGMPLDIWYGSDFFSSVLTGRTLSKASNQNVASVDYTCGLVRQALTKKITLGTI